MQLSTKETFEYYESAMQRLIAGLDTVLAAGDRAEKRMDDLYRRLGIEPGSGARALTAQTLPLEAREANRSLLQLHEALAQPGRKPAPEGSPANLPARPLASRESNRDAFTCWLAQHRPDLILRPHEPWGPISGVDLGWELDLGRTTVAYLVHPAWPESLLLMQLQPRAATHSLRSPLVDLLALIQLVQNSGTGITRVRLPIAPHPWGRASGQRRLAFCQAYLPGRVIGHADRPPTFELDLSAFTWARRRTTVRLPRANRPSAPSAPLRPASKPSLAARALGNRTLI